MYYSLLFLFVFAAILQPSEAVVGQPEGPNPLVVGDDQLPIVAGDSVDGANSTSSVTATISTISQETTVVSSTTPEPTTSESIIQADNSTQDEASSSSVTQSSTETASPSTQPSVEVAVNEGKEPEVCPDHDFQEETAACKSLLHPAAQISENKEKYTETYGLLKTEDSNSKAAEYPIPQDKGNVSSWHKIKVPHTECKLLIGYVQEGVFQQNNCIQLEIENYNVDQTTKFIFEGSLFKYKSAGPDDTTKKTVKFLSTNVHLYIKTEQGKITVFSHDDIMTLDVPTEPNQKLAAKLVHINGTQVPFFAEYSSFHPNLRKNIYSKANKKFDKEESDKKAKVKPYNSSERHEYNHSRVFAFNFFALVWAIGMKFFVSAILKYKCPKLSKTCGMPDKVDAKAVNMDETPEPAAAVRKQATPTNNQTTPTTQQTTPTIGQTTPTPSPI